MACIVVIFIKGKGKFGIVFFSLHLASKKHVAIKYIPKQIIFDTQSIARIQQEVDIISKLSHPFIVYCFGGFEVHFNYILLIKIIISVECDLLCIGI